jgi:hypothetical protein
MDVNAETLDRVDAGILLMMMALAGRVTCHHVEGTRWHTRFAPVITDGSR